MFAAAAPADLDRLLRRSEHRRRLGRTTAATTGSSAYYDPSYAFGAPRPPGYAAVGPNLFFLPNGNTLGSAGGVVGGAQVGYNFQFNQFVIGVETDFQGTSISGGGNNAPLTLFPSPYSNPAQQLPDPHRGRHRRQHQPVMVRHRARPRRLPFTPTLLLYGTAASPMGR